MAHSPFKNIFVRLPPATAVLLLTAVFSLTDSHALPRQTKIVAYRELEVIPFPPAPTNPPLSPFDLQRRQENTICGFIGGNSDLPATCSLGSHCVLDPANSVVGCCPNGGTCTTGVYTGCVDRNSNPQTEINPYVFTCQGADVCFKNNFDGGYFQFGCGTASELGTTVQTSADGASTALSIGTVDMSLTSSPVSLTTPTTIGSFASSSTTSPSQTSSRSTASSTRTSSHATSSTDPPSSMTASPTPSPTEGSGSVKQSQTGTIVGGVVGGAAALIALMALVFFCLRRRNRNSRIGPGPAPTAPPTTHYTSPMRSHGAAFAPLPSWNDEEGRSSPSLHNHPHPYPPNPYGPLEPTFVAPAAPPPANLNANLHGFSQPMRYNPVYMAVGMPKGSLTPVVEEEQPLEREEPQGREIDDFSRAYSNAGLGQLTDDDVEEDRAPLRGNAHNILEEDSSPRRSGGHRPLWQQNRQQNRNLMWL